MMIEMIEGMIVVVIGTGIGIGIEEAEGIGAIGIAIRVLYMKRKRSSKLAEDQQGVIEVTTEVILEVVPGVVN